MTPNFFHFPMTELTILQEMFLVSYSILFGIMLNTTMGLGLFFFGWIWDKDESFNWRPLLRILASLFFINFIPFAYFALIYDWLGAFCNEPTFWQIFGTFLLSLYVFGIYRIFHLIIKKFRNCLYGTEIDGCVYRKVRDRLDSIGPSDRGHLLAILFYIIIALIGASWIYGNQAFPDLLGWFILLFARINWAIFIIWLVAILLCVLIFVSLVCPKITHKSDDLKIDEESPKPCRQDRLSTKIKRGPDLYGPYAINLIFVVLFLIQLIITLFLFFVPPFSELEFNDKISIFISWAILPFTIISAISAWLRYAVTEKRNRINDLRNELEKAYGPLYSLFNPYYLDTYGYDTPEEPVQISNINLNKSEKEKLNFILSNYPFMFKREIFTYWREHLQYQTMPDDSDERMFSIDEKFILMIYDEYTRRVEEYNNLLDKKSTRS